MAIAGLKRFKGLGFEIEFHEQQAGHQTNEPEIARTDRVAGGASAPLPSMYADQYLVSLAKLTPIETIAAYVVTNGMVALTAAPSWLWGNFLVLLVLTPLVQWRLGVNNRSQLMLTTLGFLIWVFALGGPFALLVWWSPLVGALALATFTLIAPLLMRG